MVARCGLPSEEMRADAATFQTSPRVSRGLLTIHAQGSRYAWLPWPRAGKNEHKMRASSLERDFTVPAFPQSVSATLRT
jgi:hypothetical protein